VAAGGVEWVGCGVGLAFGDAVAEVGEQGVGLVDLVADGAEVGSDGAEVPRATAYCKSLAARERLGWAGDQAWRRSRAFRSWVTAPVLANRIRPRMKAGSSWGRGSMPL
jgi:hypothetical protein